MIKKLFFMSLVTIMLLISSIPVSAKNISKYQTTKETEKVLSTGIVENIDIHISRKVIDSVTATYTIPEDYNEDTINIVPSIFKAISESDGYVPGDGIKVNIQIINKSNNKYLYKDKSFILSTMDISNYEEKLENSKGFDGQVIAGTFGPNRTANSALRALYQKSIKKDMLTDEALGNQLQQKGYKGIEELNKYYLDFYNNKYNLKCTNLEDLPANVVSELFNGNNYPIKESNLEVAELGYDYWYNVLFSVLFGDEKYDYKTSNLTAIGSYMRNRELGNDYFTKDLGTINPSSENSLTTMNFYINGPYTTNAYMNYEFSAYIEFQLTKEQPKEIEIINVDKEPSDEIIPPKTGV